MAGRNFSLRLTTASAQCLSLSDRFFMHAVLLLQLTCGCRLVADVASGKHLEQPPCAPPPAHGKMEHVLSEKVLKVI